MSWQPPSAPPPGGYTPPPGGYAPPPGGYAPPPSGYGPPPGYPAYPAGPYGSPGPGAGLEYVGFGRRVGGCAIDALIMAVPAAVVFSILFGSQLSTYINQVSAARQAGQATPALVLTGGGLVFYSLFGFAISVLYFGFLVAGWGSTVGQRAVGARVVCEEDTARSLPLGRALARSVFFWGPALLDEVRVVSDFALLLVLLAGLWVLWDARKQGLHDKLGRALVVRPGLPPPVAAYGQPAYPYAYSPSPAPGPPQYLPPYPPQYPPAPPTGP